ncbi:hypothetical protein DFR29_101269 [Tahibacter aquaticus]|uniref:Uncharacterized protein n=1 Tax=Tahibacter aquaticus TaxID=520092 RepID=A0A4R6Z9P7_9GAMM|nr:hypothetical protein [Tahibacter aquaticus]TDR48647.1 hypothetical protein DFR29_101269 [Tahibacter aquaticus]
MEDTFSPRIAATLNHRLGQDATSPHIADVVVAVYREIEGALTPIVGPGGVVALYQRSLHLAKATHHWIDISSPAQTPRVDFSTLRTLLAQQTDETALAGGVEILERFSRLLVSLIGLSLSEQLLGAVWIQPPAGSPVQDAP